MSIFAYKLKEIKMTFSNTFYYWFYYFASNNGVEQ